MAKAPVAHSFILETLQDSRIANQIRVNPMFGCHAIYVGEKIVLMTRQREASPRDNGMWVIVNPDHNAQVRAEFPALRPIELFESGKEGTPSWLCLPEDSENFESDALAIVEHVIRRDERFGKVPISAKRKAKRKVPAAKGKSAAKKPLKKVAMKKTAKKIVRKIRKKIR